MANYQYLSGVEKSLKHSGHKTVMMLALLLITHHLVGSDAKQDSAEKKLLSYRQGSNNNHIAGQPIRLEIHMEQNQPMYFIDDAQHEVEEETSAYPLAEFFVESENDIPDQLVSETKKVKNQRAVSSKSALKQPQKRFNPLSRTNPSQYARYYKALQKLNPAVREYIEEIQMYIHYHCEKEQRINAETPLPPPFDLKAQQDPLSEEDRIAIELTHVTLQLNCNNPRIKPRRLSTLDFDILPVKHRAPRQINPAVRQYVREIKTYIRDHCEKALHINTSIPLPAPFNPERQETLKEVDKHAINRARIALELNCNNLPKIEQSSILTDYTYLSQMRHLFLQLDPAVKEYIHKIREYIGRNCKKAQRKNPTIPLPEPFDINAHQNRLGQIDKDTLDLAYTLLQLNCNYLRIIPSLHPTVIDYADHVNNYITINCKKDADPNPFALPLKLLDANTTSDTLSQQDRSAIHLINTAYRLRCGDYHCKSICPDIW